MLLAGSEVWAKVQSTAAEVLPDAKVCVLVCSAVTVFLIRGSVILFDLVLCVASEQAFFLFCPVIRANLLWMRVHVS